jgi:hypothetical protein
VNGRVKWGRASIAAARQSFDATLQREGRVIRQCRWTFIAKDRPVTMAELRERCFGEPHQHWHYHSIRRALRKLGAERIGRSGGRGRPGIYATHTQHALNNAYDTNTLQLRGG